MSNHFFWYCFEINFYFVKILVSRIIIIDQDKAKSLIKKCSIAYKISGEFSIRCV